MTFQKMVLSIFEEEFDSEAGRAGADVYSNRSTPGEFVRPKSNQSEALIFTPQNIDPGLTEVLLNN